LLPRELPRGQASGLYQRSSGLRSMAHPKWLMAISFNLHRLQVSDIRRNKVSGRSIIHLDWLRLGLGHP